MSPRDARNSVTVRLNSQPMNLSKSSFEVFCSRLKDSGIIAVLVG